MKRDSIAALFGIKYPIVQAGMVWCSGWKLASAVSRAGGLGLIGAGSMHPPVLKEHIRQCRAATTRPFGVNVPLLYPEINKLMDIILEEEVKIVFTSAGSPATWTSYLQKNKVKVVHVVSSVKFAKKSEAAGVDAIVAEGFEAGGHNGREETTTLCLVPMVREAVDIPLIAAGGIGSGRAMLAATVLGADGVQIGTRFAVCKESSAHDRFKAKVLSAREGDTALTMKQLTPVRLLKNEFYRQVHDAEQKGAPPEKINALLGKGRAKKGIFEGNMEEGELEIGQISATLKESQPAATIIATIWEEYNQWKKALCTSNH